MSKIEAKDKKIKYEQMRMIDNDYEEMDQEDPSIATYCICGEGHGEADMIMCDNENCKIQWFHWHCVGITSDPGDGAWYCPNCSGGSSRRFN